MKRLLIAGMICATISSAQALDPRVLIPSPVSIALTLGQWVTRDRIETYYLKVQASGRDEQDARDQAFRLAVNQAVGVLLLSETQVRDRELIRHEIINYSSGYVHDFRILDRKVTPEGVVIEIDVWVRRSHIADRLLNRSATAGTVEGGRISQQIRSIQHERAQGDRVLNAVLQDFPDRAFDIQLEPTQARLDESRRPSLQVSFWISWNRRYVDAMAEAVRAINQRRDCGGWFQQCRYTATVQAGGAAAYFDDTNAFDLVHREMVISRPVALVTVRDTMGQVRHRACYSIRELDHSEYSPWRYVNVGGSSAVINGDRRKKFDIYIGLENLPVQNLDRAEVAIVRANRC